MDENADCRLTESIVSDPDAGAWVIRILCVSVVNLAASAAARDALGPQGGDNGDEEENMEDGEEEGDGEDAQPAEQRFFVTERVITRTRRRRRRRRWRSWGARTRSRGTLRTRRSPSRRSARRVRQRRRRGEWRGVSPAAVTAVGMDLLLGRISAVCTQ